MCLLLSLQDGEAKSLSSLRAEIYGASPVLAKDDMIVLQYHT